MALGYVLITAEAGAEQSLYRQLLKIPEITELMPLFGEYDLIAKVTATDGERLAQVVQQGIRALPGVLETKTLAATRP